MPTASSVREPVRSRKRFVEQAAREQPLDRDYLESLSLRHAERTGMPLESARRCVQAVAISARKRYEGSLA